MKYDFAVTFMSDNGNYTILIAGVNYYEAAIRQAIDVARHEGRSFHSLTCTQIVSQ